MFTDFVLNGVAHGEIANVVTQGGATLRFDSGFHRPFIDRHGQRCVVINTGKMLHDKTRDVWVPERKKVSCAYLMTRHGIYNPTWNATTFRKDDWVRVDTAIVRATRQRLTFWNYLEFKVPFGGFDGMSKLVHEYEAMSDPGESVIDMDGLTDGRTDAPLFKLRAIPLPIIHSDFFFSERRLAVSRNSSTPLDTTMAEAAARRNGETLEDLTIGNITGPRYGTRATGVQPHEGYSQIYGAINFPYRVLKTDLTIPTGSNPEAVVQDVSEMMETMEANGFYGPYYLFHSTPYSLYLRGDYFRTGSTAIQRTVRERVMDLGGIADIQRLDRLTSGYQLIMVQLDPEIVQAINGMEWTTVQWPTKGGLQQNFKIMGIKVPLWKAPYNTIAGIIHGTTS